MNYYDEIAPGYDALHREEQEKKLRILAERLGMQEGEVLLDVGCGTAFSSWLFGCRFVGIDPSIGLLSKCTNGKAMLVNGRAESLPFPDGTFDAVISVTAIHNFRDAEKGISEMKRVGRGKFAFSVLKKSRHSAGIIAMIKRNLGAVSEIDEGTDIILICRR